MYEQERENPHRRYNALVTINGEGHVQETDFVLIGDKTMITYQDQQNTLKSLKVS